MIWEEFIQIPRTIIIDIDVDKWCNRVRYRGLTLKIKGATREQICPLLKVNRESRHLAMKYMLFFSIYSDNDISSHSFAISKYDVVYFQDPDLDISSIMVEGDTNKIANVMIASGPVGLDSYALGGILWKYMEATQAGKGIVNKLGNMGSLKSLYCLLRTWDTDKPCPIDLRDFRRLLQRKWEGFDKRFTKDKVSIIAGLFQDLGMVLECPTMIEARNKLGVV